MSVFIINRCFIHIVTFFKTLGKGLMQEILTPQQHAFLRIASLDNQTRPALAAKFKLCIAKLS